MFAKQLFLIFKERPFYFLDYLVIGFLAAVSAKFVKPIAVPFGHRYLPSGSAPFDNIGWPLLPPT
jgi:hypothetical protein